MSHRYKPVDPKPVYHPVPNMPSDRRFEQNAQFKRDEARHKLIPETEADKEWKKKQEEEWIRRRFGEEALRRQREQELQRKRTQEREAAIEAAALAFAREEAAASARRAWTKQQLQAARAHPPPRAFPSSPLLHDSGRSAAIAAALSWGKDNDDDDN